MNDPTLERIRTAPLDQLRPADVRHLVQRIVTAERVTPSLEVAAFGSSI